MSGTTAERLDWRSTAWGGLLRASRPKQWTKNLLVFAAPGAAGVLGETVGSASLAFVAFCLASSGTYYLNDLADLESDRNHPLKRTRPIASGQVSPGTALAVGLGLIVAALLVAYAVSLALMGMVALYLGLTTAYTVWLKHLAVVDIGVVASGFVVRAVAGGVAVDVPISRWFLIVTSFAALFVVVGRRQAEQALEGSASGATRSTLSEYSGSYLRWVSSTAAAVTMTAYCLWAFEQSEGTAFPWYELTILPFVLAMLRYAMLLDAGRAGSPEDVFLFDRSMQVLTAFWAVAFGVAVYLGG